MQAKKISITVLGAAFGLVVLVAPGQGVAADGKAVFLDKKCTKCHEIKSLGIATTAKDPKKAVDLSTAGKSHDADWMNQWLTGKIKKESTKTGKMVKHKKRWKGSADELNTLIEWILQLK